MRSYQRAGPGVDDNGPGRVGPALCGPCRSLTRTPLAMSLFVAILGPHGMILPLIPPPQKTTFGEDKAVKPRPNNSSEPMDTVIGTVKWHPSLSSNITGRTAYWTHVPPGTRSAIAITWSAHSISIQRFISPGPKRVGWMIPRAILNSYRTSSGHVHYQGIFGS